MLNRCFISLPGAISLNEKKNCMKLSKNIAPKPDKYSENFDFFYLGALATTRVPHMFPPVFPRSFAAF